MRHWKRDTREKYDALQREIVETEQALEKLEKQAGESAVALQKISVTGTNFQEVGGKIESAGKSLLPVTAAVTGVGVAGLKVASDFEKAMSGVQAITGATGEDFERLREVAINLGATTAFSSREVAEAMTEMAKAGWTTKQIIEGMAGVLDATAASGESLGTVATIVADAITGFGLSAKDSARVADLMTQAANSGTIGVSDLGESYKYVAPLAQSMGLSIVDVTTALSAMSMAGIKGSQAGTSLRTVLANMAKPSSTVANAMDELGISITNSDGSFQSLEQIIRLNRGEVKSYYISENHEPIIAPEKWEQVQRLRERRKQDRNIGQDNTEKFKNRYPLSGLLICPYCGKTLRRRQEYNKKIRWICSTYIEKGI